MKQQIPILPDIVNDNLDKLYSLCKEYKILRLWLFGSVIRDDFRKDSDVDVLYEFDDNQIPETLYLKHFWGMWDGLEALWNRKVDFVHYPDLRNPYFKAEVDASKVLIYVLKQQVMELMESTN